MTIGNYVVTMLFATLVSWGACVLVLFNVDPFDGGIIGRGLLLAALFFSLFGTGALIGFLVRMWRRKGTPLYWHVFFAFRQALILSSLATLALALQSLRLLTGWNMVVLLLGAVLVEMFFLTREPRRQKIER